MQESQTEKSESHEKFEERLDAVLFDIDQLPTMPAHVWEIQAQLQDQRTSAIELASAIENDPSLSANVLRVANSALCGGSERFVSIKDAVVRIGRREVERLIAATLLIDAFGSYEGAMDYNYFWCHSVLEADTAEFIAGAFPSDKAYLPSEAYLDGLLHDVGKLLLSQFLPADYARVRMHLDVHGGLDAVAERLLLGMDHGEIGARLLEVWGLDEDIVATVRFHHRVEECEEESAHRAALIEFADRVCHAYQLGELSLDHLAESPFALDEEQFEALQRTLDNAEKRAALLVE